MSSVNQLKFEGRDGAAFIRQQVCFNWAIGRQHNSAIARNCIDQTIAASVTFLSSYFILFASLNRAISAHSSYNRHRVGNRQRHAAKATFFILLTVSLATFILFQLNHSNRLYFLFILGIRRYMSPALSTISAIQTDRSIN